MIERKCKVLIIGVGFVGVIIVFVLMNSGVVIEICLCDINMDKVMGEVMDLVYGIFFVKLVNIYVGNISEIKDLDIVIIIVGVV